MASPGESYVQISSVLCAISCSISPSTLLPDCKNSGKNCCSQDPLNCFSFYTCNNQGQPQQAFCGPLQTFNNATLACDDGDEICYPKCSKRCQTDGNGNPLCDNNISCCLPNPDNCKYFSTCSNNNIGIGECPNGSGFDEVNLECVTYASCFQGEQQCRQKCPQDSIQCKDDCCGPPLGWCSAQYYRCINGVQTLSTCPAQTVYNETLLACDYETYITCKTGRDSNVTECVTPSNNPSVLPTSATKPTRFPIIPTTEPTRNPAGDGLENRRLLTRDEFLAIMYSVYKEIGEKFSAPI